MKGAPPERFIHSVRCTVIKSRLQVLPTKALPAPAPGSSGVHVRPLGEEVRGRREKGEFPDRNRSQTWELVCTRTD